MPSFRFRAKAVLLTYSQLNNDSIASFLSPTTGHLDHVTNAVGPPDVYRLGRELHQDGGTHFHVFASWSERISFRDQSLLDYAGSHPNILPVPRTPGKSFDYAGKDGDIIHEYGERPGEPRTVSGGRDGVFRDALSCSTKDEFLATIEHGAPRDYIMYFDAIERFADRKYAPEPAPYHSPPFETIGRERVSGWLEQSRIGEQCGERRKSLVLWGPTRTGKTVFARSLGRYVTASPTTVYLPSPETPGPPTAANPDCPPLSGGHRRVVNHYFYNHANGRCD